MNFWDNLKFSRPTEAVGDWHVKRSACFEHGDAPTAMKYAVEKMTKQLLQREPIDLKALVLCYAGTSSAGGHPCTVRLELVAVCGVRYLYRFTNESSAPRRWEEYLHFTTACERRFAHWCGQLNIVEKERAWPSALRTSLEICVLSVIAAEDAAALVVEDMGPVIALQRQVLDALRGGMGFFTAGKEGGSHLFFADNAYRRNDYGTDIDLSATYADDASMIACLRSFFDWDTRQDSYPHSKPELEVWQYIQSQLQPR